MVEFNPADFRAQRPQFASMTDAELGGLFEVACLHLDNSDASPVPYDPPGSVTRRTILFLIVCHLATLSQWAAEGQAGPIASAAEGSVSVSFGAVQSRPGDESWWNQTPCGSSAWAYLSKLFLGGFYVSAKRPHPWG